MAGDGYLIGLDYGTLSARGVLIDCATGAIVAKHAHPYRHKVMSDALPGGEALPSLWSLQHALDYTEAAEAILAAIGHGKEVHGIGLGFTASTPLPALADGSPLSTVHPGERHAYVKLWRHQSAQLWADRINAKGGAFLEPFGGKVSAEWLLAKACQMAEEAPSLWAQTARFIEAGDWLVWRLTGREARSLGLAAYKAQYRQESGYPADILAGLREKLGTPFPIGSAAGELSDEWRRRTGIRGDAVVAVAVIDSHVVMPAVGAVAPGTLVGALGTSAVYLLLDDTQRPLPQGIEGVAFGGVLPNLWCYEAGQAGFGDTLNWFVRAFPLADDLGENFDRYNAAAASLAPGENHLVALDWWSGNRVPLADSGLSGLLVGLDLHTTGAHIYRALLESLCLGARDIVDRLGSGGAPISRIVLTSGLSRSNPLLMQSMADVLGRPIQVPRIDEATAVGAAIHGAVAAGIVDYAEGGRRFGASEFVEYSPVAAAARKYDLIYSQYSNLASNAAIRKVMHSLQ